MIPKEYQNRQLRERENIQRYKIADKDEFGFNDIMINLDSFEKTPLSNPTIGLFNWIIRPNSTDSGNGKIGIKTELVDFVQIQTSEVTFPFIPYLSYSAAPTWPTNVPPPIFAADPGIVDPLNINLSQTIPNGEKVVMEIKQLNHLAFFDPNGKTHHFEYQILFPEEDALGTPISIHQLLRPDENFRSFTFNEPIRDFGNELTIQFRNPDDPIMLPQDVFDISIESFVGPIPAPGTLIIRTTLPQNLAVGDRIYIRGFNSTNNILNFYINNPNNLWVGTTGLSTTQFGLDPSMNVIPLGYAPGTIIGTGKLYIPKNRVLLSMIFRKLLPRTTIFIFPTGNN
jgi:hypothetical protein